MTGFRFGSVKLNGVAAATKVRVQCGRQPNNTCGVEGKGRSILQLQFHFEGA
jgi:hypothetical protein